MPSASSHFIGFAHRHLGACRTAGYETSASRGPILARRRDERRPRACILRSRFAFCAMRVARILAGRAPAVLVVLVAVDDLLGAGDAGKRARRDAGVGDCVARVVGDLALGLQLAAVDRDRRACRTAAASGGCPRGSVSPRRMTGVWSWSARLNACHVELERVGRGRRARGRRAGTRPARRGSRSAGRTARSTWAGRSPVRGG